MAMQRLLPLLLLALASARLAGAQTFGNPLTADQVACEERQLGRLIHRLSSGRPQSNIILWRSTPGGGVYRGVSEATQLVDVNDNPERVEKQLAFDLILKAAEDLGDMRRPLLPQATLVRRDTASNLENKPDTFDTPDVSFDLAVDVPDPTMPKSPIRITNRLAPGAGQSDRAGRSLLYDDLLSACHAEVTEFDLKVFTILARTVRATNCLVRPTSACLGGLYYQYKSVLFRGQEPLTYRMNLYLYYTVCDPDGSCPYTEAVVAVLFHLKADEKGRLTEGDVQALPWCGESIQIACTNDGAPQTSVYVLPPLRPGIDKQGADVVNRAPHLNIFAEGDSEDNLLGATINWADLLRNTAWN
jgi:hypothetical protein